MKIATSRFFWLRDLSSPESSFETSRFRSVLFGAGCSPFILSATLNKLLHQHATNPVAGQLNQDLYVDNVVSSLRTDAAAVQYYKDGRKLMSDGGFNLRSWASNSPAISSLAAKDNVLESSTNVKVLGMLWKPTTDHMTFLEHFIPATDQQTKREVLSEASKIYDPLGLPTPVTIRAKILMQEIWKRDIDWDKDLPDDLQHKKMWSCTSKDLQDATNMTTAATPSLPRTHHLTSTC